MNNNQRRIIGYIIYVAVFGLLVVVAENLDRHFEDVFRSTFRTPYFWLFLSQFIFPILVGLLLALPQFVRIYLQEGFWRTDWIVLLTVGLPAFCVAITPVAFFSLVRFVQPETGSISVPYLISLISAYPALSKVSGILLGFVLLTSLGKQANNKNVPPV